jgi:hypothetical protein
MNCAAGPFEIPVKFPSEQQKSDNQSRPENEDAI